MLVAAVLGAALFVYWRESSDAPEVPEFVQAEAEAPKPDLKRISVAGPKAMRVTTNEVLLIRGTNGSAALVHFTAFDRREASERRQWSTAEYRWRARSKESDRVYSGEGSLREDYDVVTLADGKTVATERLGHHVNVEAGSIEFIWSASDTVSGWIYYDPGKARVQALPPEGFKASF